MTPTATGGDRPGREIPKEYREIVEYLIDQHGWRYSASGKGYPKLYPSDPAMPMMTIPKTPSDRRGLRNFISAVRRAGGTWPPAQEGKKK